MKLTSSLKLLGLGSVIGLVLLFAGCGGGGGDNNLAPASLNTRTLTIFDPDLGTSSVTYTFTVDRYTSTADNGAYTYARNTTSGQATLNLDPDTLGSSFNRTLILVFATGNSGSYTETTLTGPGIDNTGNFTLP